MNVKTNDAKDTKTNVYRITSGAYDNMVLAARSSDPQSVFLEPADPKNPRQKWELYGPDTQFMIINQETRQYMSYAGGNENPLVLKDQNDPPPGNEGFFSWGPKEDWGACALQCYIDSGQNFDAGVGKPTTVAVRTRGWRHGHQRELTWNKVRV